MDLLKKNEDAPDTSTAKSPKTIRKISLETSSTSESNFKSVSQFFPSDCSFSESTKSGRKSKNRLNMTTPTVLGGLGPDLETIQEKVMNFCLYRLQQMHYNSSFTFCSIGESNLNHDETKTIKKEKYLLFVCISYILCSYLY